MKVSVSFKNAIQSYLEQRAEYDELFARSYRNPLKNIEDCITYILNYVQKSGCNGFDDDEIFGQAVHYYDEEDIKVEKESSGCSVSSSSYKVELTEEEKKSAREAAIKRLAEEQYQSLKKRPAKKKVDDSVQQMSLF